MARPKKVIDREQVIRLSRIGCTYPEMAAVLECSEATLMRRFASAVKEGKKHLKASLRRWQYAAAANGNVAMQIWLGKQFLDQREPKQESLIDQSSHVTVVIKNNIPIAERKTIGSNDRNIRASTETDPLP